MQHRVWRKFLRKHKRAFVMHKKPEEKRKYGLLKGVGIALDILVGVFCLYLLLSDKYPMWLMTSAAWVKRNLVALLVGILIPCIIAMLQLVRKSACKVFCLISAIGVCSVVLTIFPMRAENVFDSMIESRFLSTVSAGYESWIAQDNKGAILSKENMGDNICIVRNSRGDVRSIIKIVSKDSINPKEYVAAYTYKKKYKGAKVDGLIRYIGDHTYQYQHIASAVIFEYEDDIVTETLICYIDDKPCYFRKLSYTDHIFLSAEEMSIFNDNFYPDVELLGSLYNEDYKKILESAHDNF